MEEFEDTLNIVRDSLLCIYLCVGQVSDQGQ